MNPFFLRITRRLVHPAVLVALSCGIIGAGAEEPSLDKLETHFRELPGEARRWTGPLFWLHGDESRERLEQYVNLVAEGGNGSFTAESRPHNDWLGEGWYRDLAICLEAAKKRDLQMWIFDEKWWPSGEVGGLVPEQYGSKRLVATVTNVAGPTRLTLPNMGGPHLIGIVAGRPSGNGLEGESLVDLSAQLREGVLNWDVPAGSWQVIRFSWATHKSGHRYLVDGASADAVEWYLRTVYQPHYDRFKEDFGRTIVGYFYDEPETHGDWGTEVLKVLAERGVDWKRALVAWKLKLAGEEQAAARYQYQQALAEAWGRTLFGGITRWCEEHGVQSIGHFLEHGNGYLNHHICAGDMFPLQKYSSMGGIDAVFDQFVWGKRVARDAPCWQTPKLGSSVTHAYGRPDDVTMVEIFGARGQDLTYPEMKWWTDHMHASGVNFHIPHSFNPRSPRDTDCPPYFYNGGFEPRWPLYRVYANYTSRLSLMLTGGRHVCPVALLYLGGSAHVGQHVLPDQISESLQDALYDCDWLPYEVFENNMTIEGSDLRLRDERYRILIVPAAEVIPYPTLLKVQEFFERGGVVVGYGFLPNQSATLGKSSADMARLREAIWGSPAPKPGWDRCRSSAAGGRSYFLPGQPTPEQLQQVLAGAAGVHPTLEVVEGKTDHWLHVLHRVKGGHDLFFIANQNHLGEARQFRFRIKAEGIPECWDPMRNEITAIPYQRDGDRVELTLRFEPNESVLLVFNNAKRSLPMRREFAPASSIVVPVIRDAVPVQASPEPEQDLGLAKALQGSSWIWYPEGNPAQSAPPGARYFRKSIDLPQDRSLKSARFIGTADNRFVLYVNGQESGRSDDSSEGWRRPVELDVQDQLRPGRNQLALMAVNFLDSPNPAGVIGCLLVEFGEGDPTRVPLDGTWKASREKVAKWTDAGLNDQAWPAAQVVGRYGIGPWGRLGSSALTLSPVEADPFLGHCDLPNDFKAADTRYDLEMHEIQPEAAARVTINGQYAGGCIGAPLRLEVSRFLKPGRNVIQIVPFAPRIVRLVPQIRER